MAVQLSSPISGGITPTEASASLPNSRRGDVLSGTSESAPAPAPAAIVLPGEAARPAPAPSVVGGTLQVSLNPATSQVVVQVVDGTNKEVILEIPAEDAVAIAQSQGQTSGFLIDAKA